MSEDEQTDTVLEPIGGDLPDDTVYPVKVGSFPFDEEKSKQAIAGAIATKISELEEGIRAESLKGAANDVKMEAHRWAAQSLLPELHDLLMALELHTPIMMVEKGILEFMGQRVVVGPTDQPPPESGVEAAAADPNRLTPETEYPANEKLLLDNVAETVTVLDNPNAATVAATQPYIPEFDEAAVTPATALTSAEGLGLEGAPAVEPV